MTLPLDEGFLWEVAPKFDPGKEMRQRDIIKAISCQYATVLTEYNIDSFLRIAHFTAQITHECAGFRTTEEFASGENYEGRVDLGNTERGDGVRFKGRGLLQLTGRDNYRRMGDRLALPLEQKPEIAAEPLTSLRIACEYWLDHKINDLCDQDDLVAVTKAVNGGLNGFDDRQSCLDRAKKALENRTAKPTL